jgi:hypothetical protein
VELAEEEQILVTTCSNRVGIVLASASWKDSKPVHPPTGWKWSLDVDDSDSILWLMALMAPSSRALARYIAHFGVREERFNNLSLKTREIFAYQPNSSTSEKTRDALFDLFVALRKEES